MSTPALSHSNAPGKGLEEEVRHLLQLAGWHIQPEQVLGHKKIDTYAEKRLDFGRLTRVAVECKDYASPLTQADVTTIYSNYLPLLQNGLVDIVLLVTKNGLAPSAVTYVTSADGFVHNSLIDLLNSVIDLRTYSSGLSIQYNSSEVSSYYVPQRFVTEGNAYSSFPDIEAALIAWIHAEDPRPVAVLASYGMGKTTLAKRLAHVLAERHRLDPMSRIPILIRLEEFATEISLEGLLGRHFTSQFMIQGYSFPSFMELNKRGRFVIFLDGFDEMAHGMSFDRMKYNFAQLHKLVQGNSKVILGGRPTAFLTIEEQDEILHARRSGIDGARHIPGIPDYHQFELVPFGEDEIGLVMTAFQSTHHNNRNITALKIKSLPDNARTQLFNIASRPVQLRMLLEIWPEWHQGLESLTLTALYSDFIDLIIRREMEKLARQTIHAEDRRAFSRELAVWMWNEKLGTATTGAKIPDSMFGRFVKPGSELSDVRRDLLSACFVEVKQPDGYYFPHRSFQEFLLAEHLAKSLDVSVSVWREEYQLTPEVFEFLVEMVGTNLIKRMRHRMVGYRGRLASWFLQLLIRKCPYVEILADRELAASPVGVVVVAEGLRAQSSLRVLDDAGVRQFVQGRLAGPPDGTIGESKASWSRLLVLVNIACEQLARAHKVDFDKRIVRLLNSGRTFRRAMAKAVEGSSEYELIQLQMSEDLVYVSSWGGEGVLDGRSLQRVSLSASPRAGDGVVYDKKTLSLVEQKPRKIPRPRQAKSPHREDGVTRPAKYRQRHQGGS